jgi:hypothetical protein
MQRAVELKQQKEAELTATLGQLVAAGMQNQENPNPALFGLVRQSLPIRQSFLLSKIIQQVNNEIEQFREAHKRLCEKYAKKDDEGHAIMLDMEDKPVREGGVRYDIPEGDEMTKFNAEYQELLDTEVAISGKKVKTAELSEVRLTPGQAMALDWLIDE